MFQLGSGVVAQGSGALGAPLGDNSGSIPSVYMAVHPCNFFQGIHGNRHAHCVQIYTGRQNTYTNRVRKPKGKTPNILVEAYAPSDARTASSTVGLEIPSPSSQLF